MSHAVSPPVGEHPFAQFVRILGKGPNLSRPLTLDEARTAMTMVMDGEAEPVQLGAFLCLLRVKTETPDEAAGLALGIRDRLVLPAALPQVAVDWPSYAGKSRQLPVHLLAALALAQAGIPVFMHGAEGHTAGRVYASSALAALGVPVAADADDAARQLERGGFAYLTLDRLSPPLHGVMELKSLLGLRSPIHTVARMINPFRADFTINGVTHPPYLPVHRSGARLAGETRAAVFKGEGGEAERRPEKACEVWFLENGKEGCEEWPALTQGARPHDTAMDLSRLGALWRGDDTDAHAVAAVTGTMALVLRYSGRAADQDQARALALDIWAGRSRGRVSNL